MKWKCKHCENWPLLPNVVNRTGSKVCAGPEDGKKRVFVITAESPACPVALINKYHKCHGCQTIYLYGKGKNRICPTCGTAFCMWKDRR